MPQTKLGSYNALQTPYSWIYVGIHLRAMRVVVVVVVVVNVDLYSASTQTPLTRSDMDHTVLPANNTIPAFTPQSQSITAL